MSITVTIEPGTRRLLRDAVRRSRRIVRAAIDAAIREHAERAAARRPSDKQRVDEERERLRADSVDVRRQLAVALARIAELEGRR